MILDSYSYLLEANPEVVVVFIPFISLLLFTKLSLYQIKYLAPMHASWNLCHCPAGLARLVETFTPQLPPPVGIHAPHIFVFDFWGEFVLL